MPATTEDIDFGAAGLATVEVGPKIISDIVQIGNGAYSPLDRFMSLEEIKLVLDKNQLLDGIPWTMPIILQATQIDKSSIDGRDFIVVRSDCDRSVYAIIESPKIEEIPDMKEVSRGWFGTETKSTRGKRIFKRGLLYHFRKVSLAKNFHPKTAGCHELTPYKHAHFLAEWLGQYSWFPHSECTSPSSRIYSIESVGGIKFRCYFYFTGNRHKKTWRLYSVANYRMLQCVD